MRFELIVFQGELLSQDLKGLCLFVQLGVVVRQLDLAGGQFVNFALNLRCLRGEWGSLGELDDADIDELLDGVGLFEIGAQFEEFFEVVDGEGVIGLVLVVDEPQFSMG